MAHEKGKKLEDKTEKIRKIIFWGKVEFEFRCSVARVQK